MARIDALDEITAWIRENPARLGACAFHAARMVEREGLPWQLTFDRCLRAGAGAGLTEAYARLRVFHGFAAAGAGHDEPPPDLEDGGF